jgi:hypothetical protein
MCRAKTESQSYPFADFVPATRAALWRGLALRTP